MGSPNEVLDSKTQVALSAAKEAPPKPSVLAVNHPDVWRRGPRGGFVQMDRDEAIKFLGGVEPDLLDNANHRADVASAIIDGSATVMPLSTTMPPEVAADYVKMMGTMPTVENDGVVKDRGGREMFRYPTVGKIVETARACMVASKFSVFFPGGYAWDRQTNIVTMSMSFRHASGFVIEAGSYSMPVEGNNGKAVCCAVSECRKYALGLGLNMSWLDVTEDQIQKRERGVNGNGQQEAPQPTQRTTVAQEPVKPPPASAPPPPCHETRVDQYRELAGEGRRSLGKLKAIGADSLRCYSIVTGRPPPDNGKFPNPPSPSLLQEIIDLDHYVMNSYEDKKLPPDFDHAAYIELVNRGCEPNEDVLFWANGTRTAIGIDLDELFMTKLVIAEPEKKTESTWIDALF